LFEFFEKNQNYFKKYFKGDNNALLSLIERLHDDVSEHLSEEPENNDENKYVIFVDNQNRIG
jgi:hypothetical protein